MSFLSESPAELLSRIERHCSSENIKTSTFGQRHFRNPHLAARLADGNFVSAKTYRAICEVIGPPAQGEAA